VDAEGEGDPGSSPSSVSDLYLQQYEPMVRLAYLLSGSRAVAEELVQDSFVQLHRRWTTVAHPRAYLRASVVNGCRGHHRRALRERSHFPELVTDAVTPETPVILDAVAMLPYRQRAALVLRFYEDRTDEDIADVLGCRPATVRSLLHRGLLALRKVVEP
jgi:RNA polymerase sigma factor (sigma-70 family)